MEPWEIAAQDQMSASFKRFALLSWTLYHEYQDVGFDEDTAFEIVRLWNEEFVRLACQTS